MKSVNYMESVNNLGLFSLKCQTLTDWFKFSIDMKFDKDNILIKRLFRALTLDINEYVDEGMTRSFMHKYRYGEYFYVLVEPRANSNVARQGSGLDYFFVDMDGSACREFESRTTVYGSSWKHLCNVISDMPWHFTRNDVALDDFGIINLEKLKVKVNNHEYITSAFRGTGKTVYKPVLPVNQDNFDGVDSPVVRSYQQSKNSTSWSTTWGTKQSIEFQIYDKLAERLHRNVDVPYDQWIRFEMRFRGDKADVSFVEMRDALNRDEFNTMAYSLLLGLIEFKQCTVNGKIRNSFDLKHAYEYDRWDDYDKFIGNVRALHIYSDKPDIPDENKIEHMSLWDHTASGQTLALVFAAAPEKFHDYCDLIVTHFIEKGKFKKTHKEYVNALRRKFGKDAILFDDYMELFNSCFNIQMITKGNSAERKKADDKAVLDIFKNEFGVFEDDLIKKFK
ncbi:MAG: replication initiation factor domain-containing protein [Bacilli bacterium]